MKLNELYESFDGGDKLPEIEIERLPNRGFAAIDSLSYDGAPGGRSQAGTGRTEQEALDDLCDQLSDLYPPELIHKARSDYMAIMSRNSGDKAIMSQGELEQERGAGVQDERPRADFQ
jgi:hypothetical protein